jgi:hypothetical protein
MPELLVSSPQSSCRRHLPVVTVLAGEEGGGTVAAARRLGAGVGLGLLFWMLLLGGLSVLLDRLSTTGRLAVALTMAGSLLTFAVAHLLAMALLSRFDGRFRLRDGLVSGVATSVLCSLVQYGLGLPVPRVAMLASFLLLVSCGVAGSTFGVLMGKSSRRRRLEPARAVGIGEPS